VEVKEERRGGDAGAEYVVEAWRVLMQRFLVEIFPVGEIQSTYRMTESWFWISASIVLHSIPSA